MTDHHTTATGEACAPPAFHVEVDTPAHDRELGALADLALSAGQGPGPGVAKSA